MKRGPTDPEREQPGPAAPARDAAQAVHADRALLAPGAEGGSQPLFLSVFQWEIDPNDPDRQNGEHDVTLEGADYRVWWQSHASDLVYASIQALGSDAAGQPAVQPGAGNLVANLVYDLKRDGVVAIYGTAGDFRPFVEAFRRAYGL